MTWRSFVRSFLCLTAALIAAPFAQAGAIDAPATAITDNTWFVAKLNPSRIDPASVETTFKAALGDQAGEAESFLNTFKAKHEKFSDKGVETVTIVVSGDPNQGEPQPIIYAKMKGDADRGALEKMVRDELGEAEADKMEVSSDGDYMLFRKKGVDAPANASEERRKQFEEALGDSEKPAVGALISTDAMIAGVQRDVQHGAPAGLATVVSTAKWFRFEVTLGQEPKMEVILHAENADAGKQIADGLTGLADALKQQINLVKNAGGPQGAEIAEKMEAVADCLGKAEQKEENVAIVMDSKLIGMTLRQFVKEQKQDAGQ